MDLVERVRAQIESARDGLAVYKPTAIDWSARANVFAGDILPWLIAAGPALKEYVEGVLNAPKRLRAAWQQLRSLPQFAGVDLTEFDRHLERDAALREAVSGEVVSRVVGMFLVDHHPAKSLRANGRSDYPDLYDSALDYSGLPRFKRTATDGFGAALKGSAVRPVRVPDGLEIKTCRERIAVDCHHPHSGLHIVLVFSETKGEFTVSDLCVGFLNGESDYRRSQENTTATTRKFSFTGDQFHSLFRG